jgi:hypothetical protein
MNMRVVFTAIMSVWIVLSLFQMYLDNDLRIKRHQLDVLREQYAEQREKRQQDLTKELSQLSTQYAKSQEEYYKTLRFLKGAKE